MRSYLEWILLGSIAGVAWSAFAQKSNGVPAGTPIDTTVDALVGQREKLRPRFGVRDLLVAEGQTQKLYEPRIAQEYPTENLDFEMSYQGVVEIQPGQKAGEKIIAAKGKGATDLLVYSSKEDAPGRPRELLAMYKVVVSDRDVIRTALDIKSIIGGIEGLEMRVVGENIVLDGSVTNPTEMKRVILTVQRYPSTRIINLVEMSPVAWQILAEKIEEEIAGGKDREKIVRVRVLNKKFVLEGQVEKLAERQAALQACDSIMKGYEIYLQGGLTGPDGSVTQVGQPEYGCLNRISLRRPNARPPDKMMMIRADYVTLSREYSKNFRFQWAPGIAMDGNMNYTTDTGRFASGLTATVRSLFPILDTAARHGYARVLKTMTVMVRDGDVRGDPAQGPVAATFNETLTFNFLGFGGQVQSVPVTTRLTVRARSVTGSNAIQMDVQAQQGEARSVSPDNRTPPTIYSTDVNTSVVVNDSESLALGGLIAERRNVGFVRDPSNAEVAGRREEQVDDFRLFEMGRSHTLADDKSQFIIFITPSKLNAASEGTDQLKRKFRLRK